MGAKKAISWPTGAQEHSGEDPCFGRRGLAKDPVRRNQGGSRNQEVFQWRGRACQRQKDRNRLGRFGYRISEQCAVLATGEKIAPFLCLFPQRNLFSKMENSFGNLVCCLFPEN